MSVLAIANVNDAASQTVDFTAESGCGFLAPDTVIIVDPCEERFIGGEVHTG